MMNMILKSTCFAFKIMRWYLFKRYRKTHSRIYVTNILFKKSSTRKGETIIFGESWSSHPEEFWKVAILKNFGKFIGMRQWKNSQRDVTDTHHKIFLQKVLQERWFSEFSQFSEVHSFSGNHPYLRRRWVLEKSAKTGGFEIFYKTRGLAKSWGFSKKGVMPDFFTALSKDK